MFDTKSSLYKYYTPDQLKAEQAHKFAYEFVSDQVNELEKKYNFPSNDIKRVLVDFDCYISNLSSINELIEQSKGVVILTKHGIC